MSYRYHLTPIFLFGLNPRLDSPLERRLANHYFRGNGKPYFLSSDEWNNIKKGICENDSSYYDQGIGRFNYGSDGRIDTYDFTPLWDNSGRSVTNNILNLGGAISGALFGGDSYGIYPPSSNLKGF